MHHPKSLVPRAYSIEEFAHCYGIGRTLAYREIAAGRLRIFKVGRRTLISADAAEEWRLALEKGIVQHVDHTAGPQPIKQAVRRIVARLPRDREDGDAGT
jgi:excisionase family DNA binding protein